MQDNVSSILEAKFRSSKKRRLYDFLNELYSNNIDLYGNSIFINELPYGKIKYFHRILQSDNYIFLSIETAKRNIINNSYPLNTIIKESGFM